MTNEELIAKIKAEIERQKTINKSILEGQLKEGCLYAFNQVVAFLSTLESEKGQPDFPTTNEKVKEFLATHPKVEVPQKYKTPDWIFEKSEKPIPADLEEAAEKHASMHPLCNGKPAKNSFIAGAKWQAEQLLKSSPLPEDTVLFNKGVEEGKRLMMEEAVKWLVDDDYHELTEKGRFILGSVGIGYNGYYIPYSDLLKLPKEGKK